MFSCEAFRLPGDIEVGGQCGTAVVRHQWVDVRLIDGLVEAGAKQMTKPPDEDQVERICFRQACLGGSEEYVSYYQKVRLDR